MRVNITVTDDNDNTYEGTAELAKVTSKLASKAKKIHTSSKPTTIAGPADAIKKLYCKHFFKTPKNLEQIMKKLGDEGINFDVRVVSMALYRANYLTKKGSRGSYTFIQRYPPS